MGEGVPMNMRGRPETTIVDSIIDQCTVVPWELNNVQQKSMPISFWFILFLDLSNSEIAKKFFLEH